MSCRSVRSTAWLLCLLLFLNGVEAVDFFIRPGDLRCFQEQVRPNTTAKGEVVVMPDANLKGNMEIDVWVTLGKAQGHRDILVNAKDVDHKLFTIKTPEGPSKTGQGLLELEVCVKHDMVQGRFNHNTQRRIHFILNVISPHKRTEETNLLESVDLALEDSFDLGLEMIEDISAATRHGNEQLLVVEKIQRRLMWLNLMTCGIVIFVAVYNYFYTSRYVHRYKAA